MTNNPRQRQQQSSSSQRTQRTSQQKVANAPRAQRASRTPNPARTSSASRPQPAQGRATASRRATAPRAAAPRAATGRVTASRPVRAAHAAARSAPAAPALPNAMRIALLALIILLAGAIILVGTTKCSQNSTQTPADSTAVNEAEYTPETAEPTTLTVTFAGDCTLGTDETFSYSTSFNAKYEAVADPSYFLKNVSALFASDDLTVVNMEGTLTTSTTRQDKTFAFKGDAEYAQVFTTSSVEAASLANNHSHDYGDASYTDTIEAMESAGVPTFGYDRIAYMDVKGVKVALIGTYELAEHEGIKDSMVANIQTARDEGAQLVMVYIHWGVEKDTVPNQTQINLGHAAIDAGADLVIGSHPHVIQGWEKYNGKYIVYSLGNFCFGGNSNPSDKDCMIFQQTFTITGGEVAIDDQVSFIAASISSDSSTNNYQPTIAEGSEKTRIEAKIEESTQAIAKMVAQ